MNITNYQIPTIGEDNRGLMKGRVSSAVPLALQHVSFFTATLVPAHAVLTLLVTNAPYLAIIKSNTGTAVILVDDIAWRTKTRSSIGCLVALELTV